MTSSRIGRDNSFRDRDDGPVRRMPTERSQGLGGSDLKNWSRFRRLYAGDAVGLTWLESLWALKSSGSIISGSLNALNT